MNTRVVGVPGRSDTMHQLSNYRRLLTALIWARAMLCACAAGLGVAAACLLLNAGFTETLQIGVVATVLTLAFLGGMWSRGGVTLTRTALWIEEHVPDLRYSLVTLAEGSVPRVEHFAARVPWGPGTARAMWRSLVQPLGFALAGVLVLWMSTTGSAAGAAAEFASATIDPVGAGGVGDVSVEVVSPAYTREATRVLSSPSVVSAVAGSRVTFAAPSSLNGHPLSGMVDSVLLRPLQGGSFWRALYTSTERPALVRLTRGDSSRLIALEPRTDSAPAVLLTAPERDSVFREPVGTLPVAARATDDFGIQQLRIEYIVTSGSGERFTFRSGVLGQQAGQGRRSIEQRAVLSLADINLGPGDVVHIRAVATDQNSVTGPGTGYSETRTLRIARAGEYDSVAVEQAPPPDVDKALLSQRMLINLTEALIKKQRSLVPSVFQQEARSISRDQARLRKQVSDVVFSRLGDEASGEHFHGDGHDHDAADATVGAPLTPEALLKAAERATEIRAEATDFAHDETPIVAVNRPLLEAYNAMWEAGRQLDARELRAALPPMYAALDAIQRARAAERIYLRGAPAQLVIDLNKVRLQGKERGVSGSRRGREDLRSPQAIAERRTSAALQLAERDAGAAADSLLVLRIDLLSSHPAVARLLGSLSEGLRQSRDVTDDVVQLRRAFGMRTGGDLTSLWLRAP